MSRILSILFLVVVSFNAYAASMADQQKIDALLDKMVSENVVFIRHGEERSAYDARKIMIVKYAKLKSAEPINTVEDFIAKVVTVSEQDGKPYMFKLKDGTKIESAKWFKGQLALIEKQGKASRDQ